MRIELFGGPQLRDRDGQLITFQPKPGALLTLLALQPGRRLSRDTLAEALWPDEPPETTRGRLRVALATLRRAIPGADELILADTQAIWLHPRDIVIDACEFDHLLSQARQAEDNDQRIECLSRLVDLYRGPLAPRVYVDQVLRTRDRYELKIAEVRRALEQLLAERDAMQPLEFDRRSDHLAHAQAPVLAEATAGRWQAVRYTSLPRCARTALATVAAAVLLGAGAWLHGPVAVADRSPAERIRLLAQLRHAGSQAETPAQVEERHRLQAEQCVALGEEMWKASYGPDETTWIARLEPLEPDIRNSLRWLLDHNPPKAAQLAGALSRYWWIRDKQAEARRWLDPALARSPNIDSLERARALALHAVCLLQPTTSQIGYVRDATQHALAEMQQAHTMYARLGNRWGQGHTLRCMGHILHALHREVEAGECLNQALLLFTEDGNVAGQAYTLWGLSLLDRPGESSGAGRLRRIRLSLRSVQLYRQAENAWGFSIAFRELDGNMYSLERNPALRARPECAILLRDYLSECKARLDRPEVRVSPGEGLLIRKRIARTALLLNDRSTAVEQLGYLIGEQGDVRGERQARLAATYMHYIHEANDPPLTAQVAQDILRSERQQAARSAGDPSSLAARLRPLTLEAAILEATR